MNVPDHVCGMSFSNLLRGLENLATVVMYSDFDRSM